MEYEVAGDRGKDPLQTHDDGGGRWRTMLLADHLQRVGNPDRHQPGIGNRAGGRLDLIEGAVLEDQPGQHAQDRADRELQAGNPDGGAFAGRMVDDQDLTRPKHRAEQGQPVALGIHEISGHAQEIEADEADEHTRPKALARLVAEAHAQHRDKEDIESGNEAGVGAGGILQADLLQGGGGKQQQPRSQTGFIGQFGLSIRCWEILLPPEDERNQRETTKRETKPVEGHRAKAFFHADLLGHKGRAPDHGHQQQQQLVFEDAYASGLRSVCGLVGLHKEKQGVVFL